MKTVKLLIKGLLYLMGFVLVISFPISVLTHPELLQRTAFEVDNPDWAHNALVMYFPPILGFVFLFVGSRISPHKKLKNPILS